MRFLLLLVLFVSIMPCYAQQAAGDGRIYVNRIDFVGVETIDDGVLRRELRQYEGSHVNTSALEASRLRLERLPFIARAEITQQPLDDAPDQVNILITITEAPAREYRFGGAFSESLRLSGFGYFVDQNLLGTGQRLFVRAEASEFHTAAELSHTDPYANPFGISRTIALSARRFDQLTADTTELEGDYLRARHEYGYQIAEWQSIRLGLAIQDTELSTGSLASSQLEDWVRANGNPVEASSVLSTDYLTAEFLFGWHHDTLDSAIFPTSGIEQRFNLRLAVPGSEVEFYTVNYELNKYWSLNSGWTAKVGTRLGYGQKYGSRTSSLTPSLMWFAGGPDTVRGYRENRLGPKDSLGNPYGGNLLVSGQLELLMPLPEKWQKRMGLGFFYDVGNVFATENIAFLDDDGQALDYAFEFSDLRHSVGVAAKIRTPLGPLRLSYGIPLNARDDTLNRYIRDDTQRFQMAIGLEF